MKSVINFRLALLFLFSFICQVCWSQDTSKVVTNTKTTTTTSWYAQPWAWILGGVLVVILLAVLFSNRNKETSTTTVIDRNR